MTKEPPKKKPRAKKKPKVDKTKALRLDARYNWAAIRMTEEENARSLDLFKNGEPDTRQIHQWRINSMNPQHHTYDEHWENYRNDLLNEQEKKRMEVWKENFNIIIYEAANEYIQFFRRRIQSHRTLEALFLNELKPKEKLDGQGNRTGEKDIMPDTSKILDLKRISEGLNLNFTQHYQMLRDVLMHLPKDEEVQTDWLSAIEGSYSEDADMGLHDPAMNPEFYKMDDEKFHEAHIVPELPKKTKTIELDDDK